MDDPVLFREISAGGGRLIGVATLNQPRALNGLSLAMCRLLNDRLYRWAGQDAIAAVVLCGAGDKAFCAGGDLHALYRSMVQQPLGDAWANESARAFFESEYRLDYRIHTYPKPILCWGSGIIMGGGVGLMLGASHRIVTETTRFAMPEITIGLYPDVAGTWMLARLPAGIGRFLALTGARLEAADCLHFGLADWRCAAHGLADLLARLEAVQWADDPGRHAAQVDTVLRACQVDALPSGPLQQRADAIRRACTGADLEAVARAIGAWERAADPWLQRAAKTFRAGSPGSARLSHILLQRARNGSLADVFRTDYIVSLHCCAQPDFREGIRALLVDKDKAPAWNPATLAQADDAWAQRFFEAPWPATQGHPLADLGA